MGPRVGGAERGGGTGGGTGGRRVQGEDRGGGRGLAGRGNGLGMPQELEFFHYPRRGGVAGPGGEGRRERETRRELPGYGPQGRNVVAYGLSFLFPLPPHPTPFLFLRLCFPSAPRVIHPPHP